ncbi:MAG: hypothetical protein HYX53_13305 [Chloroflexi bacterium]|nr:hypothetical protein [Chloroflexota bacterium]
MTSPEPAPARPSDQEIVRQMKLTIDEILDARWTEVDELWMREIRPAFDPTISDEDFIKRIATPLTMRILSIGLQAGIQGLTRAAPIFEKPFDVVVAPSGQVSIRFRD